MLRRLSPSLAFILGGLVACGRVPASAPEPAFEVWHLASPGEGDMIVVDSASLRPVVAHGEMVALDRIVRFTNFQGSRFHPDPVRALSEDGQVMDGFARTLARSIPPNATLVIDLQEIPADEIRGLSEFSRAIAGASRALAGSRVAMIVPGGDTAAYPTAVLARVVDLLLVRLWGEYRPGTRPGPPMTSELIRRELGSRATAVGASRIAAYFPLYGFLWNSTDSARQITYDEANRMVVRQGGAFRRDPASQFLTVTSRDGWTIWVPDLTTLEFLIQAARSRGATVIALSNFRGADPAIITRYPIRR